MRLKNSAESKAEQHKQQVIKSIKQKQVKFLNLDKGNGTAILHYNEYLYKMRSITHDKSKFLNIQYDQADLQLDHPLMKAENKLKYFLSKYVKPYSPGLSRAEAKFIGMYKRLVRRRIH